MFQVEIYWRVRRAVLVEGQSRRSVAREFGISRKTVDKMLRYSVPPGYQRQQPARRPKLGPWVGVIDAILTEDKTRPAKQRHTAKRIFEQLKEEYGFSGGYTILKDYVRGEELCGREMPPHGRRPVRGGPRCSCRWCIRQARHRPTSAKSAPAAHSSSCCSGSATAGIGHGCAEIGWFSRKLGLWGKPLSCIPAVVMQKVSQGTIRTENADNADDAEITQLAYFL
jgi:transposase